MHLGSKSPTDGSISGNKKSKVTFQKTLLKKKGIENVRRLKGLLPILVDTHQFHDGVVIRLDHIKIFSRW